MAPKKRKAPAAETKSKKAKAEPLESATTAAAAAAATSPKKPKALKNMSASEVWGATEYVQDGAMSQEGLAALLAGLDIAEMSFDALFLTYHLSGCPQSVDNVWIVCPSKQQLQTALDSFGCSRSLAGLPAQLRRKCASLESSYAEPFASFFRWLFEMGKAISALNNNSEVSHVRSVPLDVGLQLMESALVNWSLISQFKAFCTQQAQPFSRDLWTQICRFAHMTKTGRICADLSNYDDDSAGGSAWPCAIDDVRTSCQASQAPPWLHHGHVPIASPRTGLVASRLASPLHLTCFRVCLPVAVCGVRSGAEQGASVRVSTAPRATYHSSLPGTQRVHAM
jgi:hypothetical protein